MLGALKVHTNPLISLPMNGSPLNPALSIALSCEGIPECYEKLEEGSPVHCAQVLL